MENQLLLRIRESVSLTGLGVLLFPTTEATALRQFGLHTALLVQLRQLNGHETAAVATIEEVSRPNAAGSELVLLMPDAAATVPAGTEVWWNGTETDGL